MTIRSGGRPRDPRGDRAPHARPYDPDAYATESMPETYTPVRRPSRNGHRQGGGAAGIIRFLLFAIVLGAVVLAAGLTALRPVIEDVGRTPRQDAYVRAGDPIGYRHLCQAFVHMALPGFEDIPVLASVRVEMPQWTLLTKED